MQNNLDLVTIRENSSYWSTTGSIDTKSQYKPLATFEVVEYFKSHGFYITKFVEMGARLKKNYGKTKHRVIMRHIDDQFKKDAPEILITNAHNKYSSLWLNIGIYRMVCGNGQIMGDTFFSERVRHTGDTKSYLDDLYLTIMKKFQEVENTVARLKGIELSQRDKVTFITQALTTRFQKSKYLVELGLNDIQENLQPQRFLDNGNDLYTVMNVIQERMIRGGFKYHTYDKKKRSVRKETKEVKSLKMIDDINKGLMDLALKTAEVVNA